MFVSALKRFIARREKLAELVNDYATNFKGESEELREFRILH